MERLNRIIELCDKVENGNTLTESETTEIKFFVDEFTILLNEVRELLMEIARNIAEAFIQWWELLPKETQTAINQSLGERMISLPRGFQSPLNSTSIGPIGNASPMPIYDRSKFDAQILSQLNRGHLK